MKTIRTKQMGALAVAVCLIFLQAAPVSFASWLSSFAKDPIGTTTKTAEKAVETVTKTADKTTGTKTATNLVKTAKESTTFLAGGSVIITTSGKTPTLPKLPKLPDVKLPSVKVPEVKLPSVKAPEVKAPLPTNIKLPGVPTSTVKKPAESQKPTRVNPSVPVRQGGGRGR